MEVLKEEAVCSCSEEQFVSALEIYIQSPHSINKRLVGAIINASSEGQDTILEKSRTFVRKLVPKSVPKVATITEEIEWDRNAIKATFKPSMNEGNAYVNCCYSIRKDGDRITLKIAKGACASDASYLAEIFFPGLIKWCREEKLSPNTRSLRLVCLEKYQTLYNELKTRHGTKLIEVRNIFTF